MLGDNLVLPPAIGLVIGLRVGVKVVLRVGVEVLRLAQTGLWLRASRLGEVLPVRS